MSRKISVDRLVVFVVGNGNAGFRGKKVPFFLSPNVVSLSHCTDVFIGYANGVSVGR